MKKGVITLSEKEVDRLSIIQAVAAKQLRQAEAAIQLGLGCRQVKRLVARYRQHGATGLASSRRGKPPNNTIASTIREQILHLFRTQYADFGPTLACEKLSQRHGHTLSPETLRQWLIAEGLWQPKCRRVAPVHQRRLRRPCLGELIQIDGSPHDWFEGRAPRCTLLVFIDDATSRLMRLHFAPAETTQAYMETLASYLSQYGRPVALYSDKHSIFRVNHAAHEGELTQFSRALKTLDIQAIHAHTPQAKGRVERANQTLQDRLVKELRLQGISDMAAANVFLPTFMADYNKQFAVAPQNPLDAHRPVQHNTEELALIFCRHTTRKLSKNLTCQFNNREYQVQAAGQGYTLRGAMVTVCEAFDGQVTLLYKGKALTYRLLAVGEAPTPLADEKSVHSGVDEAKRQQASRPQWKPPVDHPWRRQPIGSAAHSP